MQNLSIYEGSPVGANSLWSKRLVGHTVLINAYNNIHKTSSATHGIFAPAALLTFVIVKTARISGAATW